MAAVMAAGRTRRGETKEARDPKVARLSFRLDSDLLGAVGGRGGSGVSSRSSRIHRRSRGDGRGVGGRSGLLGLGAAGGEDEQRSNEGDLLHGAVSRGCGVVRRLARHSRLAHGINPIYSGLSRQYRRDTQLVPRQGFEGYPPSRRPPGAQRHTEKLVVRFLSKYLSDNHLYDMRVRDSAGGLAGSLPPVMIQG